MAGEANVKCNDECIPGTPDTFSQGPRCVTQFVVVGIVIRHSRWRLVECFVAALIEGPYFELYAVML